MVLRKSMLLECLLLRDPNGFALEITKEDFPWVYDRADTPSLVISTDSFTAVSFDKVVLTHGIVFH